VEGLKVRAENIGSEIYSTWHIILLCADAAATISLPAFRGAATQHRATYASRFGVQRMACWYHRHAMLANRIDGHKT